MKFKYAVVVTGFMDVPDERTARLAAIEGVAITGKLLTTRPNLTIDVTEEPEEVVTPPLSHFPLAH